MNPRFFVLQTLIALFLSGLLARPAAAQPGDDPGVGEGAVVRYDGHKVVRVKLSSHKDLQLMLHISPDVWSHSVVNGEMDFRVTPEGLRELEDAGLDHVVLIDDVQRKIDQERAEILAAGDVAQRGAATYFEAYRDYATVSAYVDTLVALRPDIASRFLVGKSLQGEDIFGIRITGPGAVEEKPAILLNGCQHAREWVAVTTPMFIADKLVRGYDTDPEIQHLVDGVEFFIVPIVNPDGYMHSWTSQRLWRKNRRNNGESIGVDLNRNWGYQWGGAGASTSGSNDTYRGPAAFSEPETQVLRDFILANERISAHIDFHSYSQLILSPWGYTVAATPDEPFFDAFGDLMAQAIASVHGAPYTVGPAGSTLYLASGIFSDWAYGDRGVASWTFELRDTGANGFLLPASQIIPTGEENFEAVKRLASGVLTPLVIDASDARPEFGLTGKPTPVALGVAGGFGAAVDPASVRLLWRAGDAGPFTEVAMTDAGGARFESALPGASCGVTFSFYFSASTTGGQTQTHPADAPDSLYSATIGDELGVFADNFETDLGWQVGAPGDTATSGLWERVVPVGTAAQPGFDNPAGVGDFCYITGNGAVGGALGANDVDGGATTLTSPALDCVGPGEAYISYHRWYSNDQGAAPNQDSMPVLISNDDGATWTELELVTENAHEWVRKVFRVLSFVEPTSQVRLRFVARDDEPGSIVEAGVDDVEVFFIYCEAGPGNPADLDGDGAVGSSDLAILLGSWGACAAPPDACPADLDGDEVVGAADLASMLGSWS